MKSLKRVAVLPALLSVALSCCTPDQGCEKESVRACVAEFDPVCGDDLWDEQCIKEAQDRCELVCVQSYGCGKGTIYDTALQQCVAFSDSVYEGVTLTKEQFFQSTYRNEELCEEDGTVSEERLMRDLVRAVRTPDDSTEEMERLFRTLDTDGDGKLTVYELGKALEEGRVSLLHRGWENPTPAPNSQPSPAPNKRPPYCSLSGGKGFGTPFGSERGWSLPCEGDCPDDQYPPVDTSYRPLEQRTSDSAQAGDIIYQEGQEDPPNIVYPNMTRYPYPLSNKHPWYVCVNSWGALHGWWNKKKSDKRQRVDFRIFSNDRCALTVPQVEAAKKALMVRKKVVALQDEVNLLLKNISNFPGGPFEDVKQVKSCKDQMNKWKFFIANGVVECLYGMATVLESKSVSPIRYDEDAFRLQLKPGADYTDQCLELPTIWKSSASTKAPTRKPGENCKCDDSGLPKSMKCPAGTTFGTDACGGGGCQPTPCPSPVKPKGKYLKVDQALVSCKKNEAFAIGVCEDSFCTNCDQISYPANDACTFNSDIKAMSDLVQSSTGTCVPLRKELPVHDFQTVQSLLPQKCWNQFDTCSFEPWNIREEAVVLDLKWFTSDRNSEENKECLYDAHGEAAKQVRALAGRYSADIQTLAQEYNQALYTPGLSPEKKHALKIVYQMIFPKTKVDWDSLDIDKKLLAKPSKMINQALLTPDETMQIWPDPGLTADDMACGFNSNTFDGEKIGTEKGYVEQGKCVEINYKQCPVTQAPTRKPTTPAPTEAGESSKSPTTKQPTPVPTFAPTFTASFPAPKYVKIPEQTCNIYRNITWQICNDKDCSDCTEHTIPNSWSYTVSVVKFSEQNDDVLANLLGLTLDGHLLPWSTEDRYDRCKTLESMGQPFGTTFPGSVLVGCSGPPIITGNEN